METQVELRKSKKESICDVCGKTFKNIYTLAAHAQHVHQGIKQFTCALCNQSFATKHKLKRHHSGVHSAIRDHQCEVRKLSNITQSNAYQKLTFSNAAGHSRHAT